MKKTGWRRISLCILEICLFLVLLAGCLREEEEIYAYESALTDTMQFSLEDDSFRSRFLELSPGVYQIRLSCDIQEDYGIGVELLSDTAGYKHILGNYVNKFPGQASLDFEVYVTGRVSDAYVKCDLNGGDVDVLKSLTICRTNLGCRIMLFWFICLLVILEGLCFWRRQILTKRVPITTQVVFWGLTAGVLLAYLPYLTDYFSLGADTGFHLLRIEGLKESLQNIDHFPIRVQSYWMYDHGSVVPSMYGDFFLLFPALLRIIGFPLMSAYKIFIFAVTVLTAWITYFSFRKCTRNNVMALVGSLMYLLSPYRIYNIFVRGAEGEYMAMTFLPLVCCGMYLLYTEPEDKKEYRQYKWWIVAGMSAMILCHPLTTELAAVFMFVVCVVFWKKTFRKKTFMQLVWAVIWVILLNCWFLVPMLWLLSADKYHLQDEFGRDIQQMGTQLAGVFQIWPNVGNGGTIMYSSEPIQIGGAGIGCLLLFTICAVRDKKYRDRVNLCLYGLTLLALLLSTRYFPWNWLSEIPLVRVFVTALQFPTRIMTMASVLYAMFAAAFLTRFIDGKEHGRAWLYVGGLMILLVGSALYETNDILLERGGIRLYTAENMGTTSSWSRNFIFSDYEQEEFCYHQPVAEEGLIWEDYTKKGTHICIYLKNDCAHTCFLELPLMGYRGYGIKVQGEQDVIPTVAEERGAHGDLRIAVPAGYEGEVEISYQGIPLFRISEGISVTAFVCAGWGAMEIRRKERRHGKATETV